MHNLQNLRYPYQKLNRLSVRIVPYVLDTQPNTMIWDKETEIRGPKKPIRTCPVFCHGLEFCAYSPSSKRNVQFHTLKQWCRKIQGQKRSKHRSGCTLVESLWCPKVFYTVRIYSQFTIVNRARYRYTILSEINQGWFPQPKQTTNKI
jgi:hypothetical protein